MRISIKQHHAQFIKNLAEGMGCDATEALNYLLWQYRWNQQAPTAQALTSLNMPSLQPVEKVEKFELKSPALIQEFEQLTDVQQEIDPIIERLISLGVCNEF